MIRSFAAVVAALFATSAYADVAPVEISKPNGCKRYSMCSAQAGTGVCTSGGDEVVLRSSVHTLYQFYSTQSTGTFSCKLLTSDAGYDSISGAGADVTGAVLTNSAEAVGVSGVFDALWFDCTANSGAVTITAIACPSTLN